VVFVVLNRVITRYLSAPLANLPLSRDVEGRRKKRE